MPAAAAIDIGSNGVRLAIGVRSERRPLELLGSWRESVRLGKDVFSSGKISDESIAELENALNRFGTTCRNHKVSRVRAVGTSALREAKNLKKVLREIKSRTGIPIEPIPPEEEARLVFLAVASQVPPISGTALLVDIGGGSIELSLVENGELIRSESAPMGALRVLKLFESRSSTPKIVDRLVREYARGIRQQFMQEHRRHSIRRCYGTGGNIEALGQLRKQICKGDHTDRITLPELAEILEKLQSMSVKDRIDELGLRPDRADVIFPAAAVMHQLLVEAKVEELFIPGVGLKEGLLLEQLEDHPPELDIRRKTLLDYGIELGRHYDFDEKHGKAVASHARSLFFQTQSLHHLRDEFALYLELAALLHDIGQFIGYPSHHKHSYYLLSHSTFVGLLPWERQIVASIARYHRKSEPKPQHESFSDLRPEDREPVRRLAAILRIADALDRQHESLVNRLDTTITDSVVTLRLSGRGDMLLESWAAKKKSDMFESVFDRKIAVEGAG